MEAAHQNSTKLAARSPTGLVSSNPVQSATTPEQVEKAKALESMIAELAYCKWERAGKPPGDDMRFWLEAEFEIRSRS